MLASLATGMALGLAAGVVPGPFLTLVTATALEHGLRAGRRVALLPLATEGLPMIVTALALAQIPHGWFRWIGMLGGAVVGYLAWRVWRAGDRSGREAEGRATKNLIQAAVVGLLSPAPWTFWLLVGSPLLLASWSRGWGAAVLFVGSFFACFVGVMLAAAFWAARGREKLERRGYRRIMRAAAVFLAAAGATLVWQSWQGNFQEMVRPPRVIEDAVGR